MDEPAGARVAANRERQRAIYGEPLGERVRRLTAGLGITQARLAATVGLSPAMLSQLSGARRVKIGDPTVLGRLAALDRRVADGPVPAGDLDAVLRSVRSGTAPWGPPGRCACGALRADTPADGGPGRGGLPAGPRAAAGGIAAGGAAAPGPQAGRVRHGRQAPAPTADDALRRVSEPARLVAAAAELAPSFPEIAEALLRAAARRP